MRQISLFLIAVCISVFGQLYSKRLESRVKKLEKISSMLLNIKTEIEFSASDAKDILASISTKDEYNALPFTEECCKKLKSGETFEAAWTQAISNKENTMFLKNDDTDILLSFGKEFGKTDTNGQLSNCLFHKCLIDEKLTDARRDFSTLSKPAKTVSALAGAAVYVIFM